MSAQLKTLPWSAFVLSNGGLLFGALVGLAHTGDYNKSTFLAHVVASLVSNFLMVAIPRLLHEETRKFWKARIRCEWYLLRKGLWRGEMASVLFDHEGRPSLVATIKNKRLTIEPATKDTKAKIRLSVYFVRSFYPADEEVNTQVNYTGEVK